MTREVNARGQLTPEVIDQLIGALGTDAVITHDEGIAEFADPYWIPGDETFRAAGVVEPTSVEQVQAVMRIANAASLPVWAHSQGRNNGYGGPSPRVKGSLQISLRKMNKVLEINEDLAYAVVEPGVRWYDLYDALQAAGSTLQLSVPDLGWGSVIGNSLDNGITYMPYGSDFMAPCGMEVVLADGSLLRTGMGAIPDNTAWHTYKRGLGPTLDQLFIQSNFGIVVRMGVWLQRRPEKYAPLWLTVPRDSDLETAVEMVRELRMDGTLQGVPSIYTTLTAAPQMGVQAVMPPGILEDHQIQAIADETGVGRWAVRCALWGDSDIVDAKLAKLNRVWTEIPGATVVSRHIYAREDYDKITAPDEKIQAGIPDFTLMELSPPWLGHIGFSPIVPMIGGEVRWVLDQMRAKLAEVGLNFLGGLLCISERSCSIVCGIPFDVRDEEQVRGAFRAANELVREVGAAGYGEYRAHLDFMDAAQDIYSFEDNAYRRFVEAIKDAVDPNGIIAPGRHGIWPAAYRE